MKTKCSRAVEMKSEVGGGSGLVRTSCWSADLTLAGVSRDAKPNMAATSTAQSHHRSAIEKTQERCPDHQYVRIRVIMPWDKRISGFFESLDYSAQ